MNTETLSRISKWGKFLGILMIISGIINTIVGLFAFVIGAIPGLVVTWLGYIIYKTGRDASKLAETRDDRHLEDLLDGYGKYLLVNGILTIVSLAAVIIMFLVMGASIFALISAA